MVIVDTSVLKRKIKNMQESFQKQAEDFLIDSSLKGAETASRYTPPKKDGSWSKNIKAKDYKRPVYSILYLLKNKKFKKFTKQFREKFSQGYRFFVYKDTRKNSKKWFTKTSRQAKSKYGRIKYRGLLKLMYGLSFLKQGKLSTVFSNLLSKSPQLSKINLNETKYQKKQNNTYRYTNINKTLNSSLGEIGKKKSTPVIKRVLKNKVKKWKQDYCSTKKLK